jgi:hypothetical protein
MYIPIEYMSGSGSVSSNESESSSDDEKDNDVYISNILLYFFLGWFILIIVIIILTYLYLCLFLLYQYIKNNLCVKLKNCINCKNCKNKILPITTYNLKYNLKYKSKIITKNINKIDECSICLDNNNKHSVKIKCNHIFHNKCIEEWKTISIKNNNIVSCPLCRTEI